MQNIEVTQEILSTYPYNDIPNRIKKYAEIGEFINKRIMPNSDVVDLGCGSGILCAFLSRSSHNVTGVDDLADPSDDLLREEKVQKFMSNFDVSFVLGSIFDFNPPKKFDVVIMNDVVEHFDNPRILVNHALNMLKTDGMLFLGLPNSVSLLKRLKCLFGKTNYPALGFTYYNIGKYRSHIREYTLEEAYLLLQWSGLTDVKVTGKNLYTKQNIANSKGTKKIFCKLYGLASDVTPTFRDTILAYGRKPNDWVALGNDSKQVQKEFNRLYKLDASSCLN